MKRKLTLISVAVVFILLFSLFISPASAGFKPEISKWMNPCKEMRFYANFSSAPNLMALFLFPAPPPDPRPQAPVEHTDGRLNYMVCRAPLAVFMNEDGSVEIWSTNSEGMYAPLTLEVSATAEEIAAALALAAELGQDVIIDGYVDGFALIAKADGTLKAELLGEYGCDFEADGEANNGWCLGFEELIDE